jgi:hypothetical protein
MPTIQVGVINPSETEKFVMQVPDDVPVRDLQEAMVEQMNLPIRGNNGERLRYHLNVRNQDGNLERLDEHETLDENDVEAGDVLQLNVEMVAGSWTKSQNRGAF